MFVTTKYWSAFQKFWEIWPWHFHLDMILNMYAPILSLYFKLHEYQKIVYQGPYFFF